jgi:hypothetical protein
MLLGIMYQVRITSSVIETLEGTIIHALHHADYTSLVVTKVEEREMIYKKDSSGINPAKYI